MSDNITGAEQGALPPGARVVEHRAGATPSAATPLHLASTASPNAYVLSSPQPQQSIGPVPSLSQLTATTSPSSVYTKIINISNIRNANITNPSIVSALTKPRVSNVRTQLFPTSVGSTPSTPEAHGASPSQQQLTKSPSTPRKRARPDELPPGCDNLSGTRAKVMEHKWARSWCIKESYNESVAENYFLGTGGTMMDYFMWRKRPRSAHYETYLRQHQLEPSSSESTTAESHTSTAEPTVSRPVPPLVSKETPIVSVASAMERLTQSGTTTSSTHTSVPEIQPKTTSSVLTNSSSNPSTSTAPAMTNILPNPLQITTASVAGPISSPRSGTTPQPVATSTISSSRSTRSIASAFPATGNQEQIVEKAKQEAYVMQRISELQREGLWTERRLPKVQEVQRCKSHWDYLLEEMVWLAADFAQERKWKKAAAKKCARMVQKYFQDKAMAAQKAEKAQELQLKRIASYIAKEVKTFWSSVEKLVEFKQQTRLEEKRKQALDQQLSFIVDQTEKYSQLLAEGMNKSVADQSANQTANSSRVPSPSGQSDDEFKPGNQSDSDDEETIAQAEAADESDKQTEEIAALQRESQMELEDFLKELPKDYLENRDKIVLSDSEHKNDDAQLSDSGSDSENKENKKKKDEDFKADSQGESEDDEDTINEQETVEGSVDHKQELNDLKAENEMTVEELRKKYLNLPALPDNEDSNSKQSMEDSDDSESSNEEEEDEESEESTDENSEEDEDETLKEDDKLGLKMLVEDEATKDSNSGDKKPEDDDLINDVAALAESIQPKGNTLSSTSVVTPVPFLLKHSLREYQHIGLDWLVTMFERKLNGILADEMGLGKTIQTIALLAHLACEKGDWGPHLIIVPTSVMLNWEMECKKWCPGFKILTYYGTQKERKLKRTGWTKPNAFHICITSYKLVIQDHQSFRRKKWKYLILDEAQNIKNFKSQRWQLLLNFQTQQRLLLTGTPLQNNLMELWSLMHFLMPNVFQSHREFKEWFSNPVTGMIEGNSEYNESIIKRLHKVLRPFLLRRLKSEVEKQMPQKFEHIIMCRLSKRQRFLYDDYMSRAKTRETLVSGNLLSVINVLMQLRKVCNHPNLFEVRPTVSPFQCESLQYLIPSIVYSALDYDLFKHVNLDNLYLRIVNLEYTLSAYSAFRTCRYRAPKKLIEMIDDVPEPPPPCPKGQVRIRVKQVESKLSPGSTNITPSRQIRPIVTTPLKINTVAGVKLTQSPIQQGVKLRMAGPTGYSVQIVSSQGVKGAGVLKPGDQRVSVPTGFAQLVQTQLGKHILLTQNASLPQTSTSGTTTVLTSTGQRLTVLSKPVTAISTTSSPQKTAVVNSTTKMITPTITTVVTATKQVGVDSLLESSQLATEQSALSGMSIKQSLSSLHHQLQSMSPSNLNNTNHNQQMQTRQSSTSDMKGDDPSKCDVFKSEWSEKSSNSRQAKLSMLHRLNEWRCHASPMYGQDLRDVVTMTSRSTRDSDHWMGAYVVFDEVAKGEKIWEHGGVLREFVKSPETIVEEMQDMFSRFVFCVPAVAANPLSYRVLNPPQSKYWGEKRDEYQLIRQMSPRAALLHPIASAMCTQFPDPRLIQYDCGKLQTLDLLLRRLKYGGHRVLIFTQMTRMLDVLEAFLNFHGHIYLRLDGTTKVDQRQLLMERFNGNTKIFAFILSTRSGGVGVNLTGADTVIFYDSDWNPTMDAQAQDRCHRIGQTRDVHIYRLVSEKTIEENILKKANQKRMLGDLAIEGGNFTTAYFKSSTIQDLFNVDTAEDDANARMSEVLNKSRAKELKEIEAPPVPSTTNQIPPSGPVPAAASDDRAALGALENALAACEDDQDVQAARTAKAEAVADLAEFDESIPLEEHEKEQEISKAELEVQNLMKQLTPIERYAMRFVEATEAQWSAEQLAAAERQIEDQKREWEENRLSALRQEEERRSRQAEEDSEMLTFSREDATNQVGIRRNNSNKNRRSGNFARRGRRSNNRRFNKRDSVRIVPGKRKRGARNCTTNINSLSPRRKSPATRKSVENRNKHEKSDEKQSGEDDTIVSNISNITNINSNNESNSSIKDEVLSDDECTLSALDETPVSDSPKTPTTLITKYIPPSPVKTPPKDNQNIETMSDEEEVTSPVSTTKPSTTTTPMTKKGKNSKSNLNSTPITNKNDKKEDDNIILSEEEEVKSSTDDETDELPLNNHISDLKHGKQNSNNSNTSSSSSNSNSENSEDETSDSSLSSTNSSNDSNDLTERNSKRTRLITNKLDHNSPRTRSRGTVKINLWTLDVSPILPGVKPVRSGTPLPKHRSKIFKFRSAKSVDKCNNKKSEQNTTESNNKLDKKMETDSIIEECITSKVSVVMTDVLTVNHTTIGLNNLVQNNSVSSTSDSLTSINNPPFKKPKSPLKYRSSKLPADQKSLDDWLTKVPSSPNNSNNTHSKRPSTPFPGSRTRRSGTKSDDSVEPPKKVKIVKSESSNGPVTT